MAYYDREAADRYKAQKEAFNKLKKQLEETKVQDGKVDFDKVNALNYINEMEGLIKEQDKKLEKYNKFFSVLDEFLPEHPSIHDRIG